MAKNLNTKMRYKEIELRNELDSVDNLREFYEGELAKKDQIIEQQRAMIKALAQKSINEFQGTE